MSTSLRGPCEAAAPAIDPTLSFEKVRLTNTTGLRFTALADHGAFNSHVSATKFPAGLFSICTSSYDIPNAYCRVDAVYTNKAPGGVAYRCSLRVTEAVYLIERMIDVLAQKLGIDKAEIRWPSGQVQTLAAPQAGRLHRITVAPTRVSVWPVSAEVDGDGLLPRLLDVRPGTIWPGLHSAWLCPEIPIVFELGLVLKVPVAPASLPQPAAGRVVSFFRPSVSGAAGAPPERRRASC